MENKELTDKQLTKQFWADFCDHCKGCKKTCKQSFKAKVLFCKNYDKKE